MIQFRIIHLLAATAYASLIAALIPFGEMGRSVIPILVLPLLFLIPCVYNSDVCPGILKTRYHVGIGALLSVLLVPGIVYEYGWWRIPFNILITLFLMPAVLAMLQLIKHQSGSRANIELRIAQIVAIWLPITMFGIARCFGRMMPLV
ncbi:hypothetical protein MFFC18_18110 [Mariniblastus fucicola]|uniref:Uncharacterized protein n=1 Tax=Mariniblastus fucicola TaxID=980251 RepID=A0A5B9PAJ5_9BACT|nr:hypothetical protein MFFC18_18110 [Mariniblastus fucicola]